MFTRLKRKCLADLKARKKISRLKYVKEGGVCTRNNALVYLDGDVLIGHNHPSIISGWLKEKGLAEQVTDNYLNNYSEEEKAKIKQDMQDSNKPIPPQMFEDLGEFERKHIDLDLPYAAADYSKINNTEKIVILTDFLQHVSLEEVIEAFHNKFPNAIIFDYDTDEILYQPEGANTDDIDNQVYNLDRVFLVRPPEEFETFKQEFAEFSNKLVEEIDNLDQLFIEKVLYYDTKNAVWICCVWHEKKDGERFATWEKVEPILNKFMDKFGI